MSIEKTIKLQADVSDALKKLEDLDKKVEDIGESTKKTEKATDSLASGFKGVGLAIKAMGIGLVMAAFEKLSEALMRNQAIADTINTVFNSIGVAFKLVTDAIVNTYTAVAKSTENFDALGGVAKNVLDIAITPLKLGFQSIKLGIQSAMLAWEKSFLGGKGKDLERIAELTESINQTKQSIKDTANEALQSGKEIVGDFVEMVDEVSSIGKVAVDSFKEVFEGVTITSIIEQGKAITQTKKNYELLALQQQRLIEQYDREAESQRQIRDDVRLSIDERIAANQRLGEILEKQAQAEKDAIQAQINATQQLIDAEGENIENTNQLFQLKTELLAVDAKITGMTSEQKTNEAALHDERVANLQELSTLGQTEMERQMSDLEIQAENRRTLAERTIADEQQLADTLLLIDQDLAAKKQEILDAEKQARQDANFQAMNQAVSVGQNILGSLADIQTQTINQQQSALDKQLEDGTISQEQYDKRSDKLRKDALKKERRNALLQILISTAQGVAGAVKAGAGVPFPGNLIAIATGLAAVIGGIAQAKAVMSQTGEGGGGDGGGDMPSPSVAASGGIGGDLIPNMENVEQPTVGGDTTVQAFVVENDISNAQALQQELDTQATL